MIHTINGILREYALQGYDLTVRQLYYQLVANNLIPEDKTYIMLNGKWVRSPNGSINAEPNYKWIGDIVSDGRMAGLIDWDMIKDRGRELVTNPHWSDPAQFMEAVAPQFRTNLWEGQQYHIEVMVEKQALEGILIPVCRRYDVGFMANKGYSSMSALYETSQRFLEAMQADKKIAIIYLGDHDPSGIDMTRDVEERIDTFLKIDLDRGDEIGPNELPVIEVQRVALNMDQIKVLNPPENPAKVTDSRAKSYIERFGESSWELDAIKPESLDRLVSTAIEHYMDKKKFNAKLADQDAARQRLKQFAKQFK